jgi:hypothetical protein
MTSFSEFKETLLAHDTILYDHEIDALKTSSNWKEFSKVLGLKGLITYYLENFKVSNEFVSEYNEYVKNVDPIKTAYNTTMKKIDDEQNTRESDIALEHSKKLDALISDFNDKLNDLTNEFSSTYNVVEEGYIEDLRPLHDQFIERLDKLDHPSSIKNNVLTRMYHKYFKK